MSCLWINSKRIQERCRSNVVLTERVVGNADVDPYPCVLWSHLQHKLIHLQGVLCVQRVCQGGSPFVPKRMVKRVLFDCILEIDLGSFKVSLNKGKNAKGHMNLEFLRYLLRC